ncbi:trans-aconitate 2-methyltransferase [Leptothrix discophora]|uniref:Trans-aconitate 2-methyltransferase n=1 Tax=Leptothrix discophora TaxID=89 RepID=A0ABT9FYW7_LEPDI|nr:trans-aconitate 2-methyltransferase [Leptothrix discophora]MDP4299428.1 trans-aconitate 2-methyltransferase [Leptothrix discophora]
MSDWNDTLYLRFGDQRTRAAVDLLARVQPEPRAAVHEVVDLGCGPGNSTALLAARWPQAHITGVDRSPAMLQAARRALPALDWVEADVATWQASEGRPVDLLFANAVFQWVPDHARLLPRLLGQVRPGGVLALQMPANRDEPSHRWMRELPGPWSGRLGAAAEAMNHVLAPADYFDLLAPLAAEIDLWETRYEQVMDDADAIVDWVRATGLRPFLDALADESERADYLAAYRARIDAAYPRRADGRRLFRFPRLFMVVRRA